MILTIILIKYRKWTLKYHSRLGLYCRDFISFTCKSWGQDLEVGLYTDSVVSTGTAYHICPLFCIISTVVNLRKKRKCPVFFITSLFFPSFLFFLYKAPNLGNRQKENVSWICITGSKNEKKLDLDSTYSIDRYDTW